MVVPRKIDIVCRLLRRRGGCTRKEVLAATGWPSVSMQAMARHCSLNLRIDKVKGKPTKYYGTP